MKLAIVANVTARNVDLIINFYISFLLLYNVTLFLSASLEKIFS